MNLNSFFQPIIHALPGILGALLLLIVALILATLVKRYSVKGLRKIDFDQKLQKWGMARNDGESDVFLETIGSVLFFIIILFFIPFILNGLELTGIAVPIISMFESFFAYIPNIIAAAIILIVGLYFCKFVKRLVQNLLEGFNIDKWYARMTGQTTELTESDETKIAEVLASVVYVLIFIPILTVALETLGIRSISEPIVGVLNQVTSAIPNIFVAIVLFIVGGFIAKMVGDLVESLLRTSGVDRYSRHLNFKGENDIRISGIAAQILKTVLMIFFIVEAVSVLRLDVLNAIGAAVIAYMPAVLSAVIILAVGIIGGNILANFLSKASGSRMFGEFVRYSIIVLAVFMTLDQLQFAKTIVNAGFIIILSAIAVAFAISFGLGGRDFAARQLEKAEEVIEEAEADKTPVDLKPTDKL